MEQVLRVRVTVKKYAWHEFVRDVIRVLVWSALMANAFSWRFLHISLLQVFRTFRSYVTWGFWGIIIGIWIYELIVGALGWR